MTDKKFTQEQIIKALECCGFTEDCSGCPFYSDMGCDENIHANALDLIKRQKAEIERVQLEIESCNSENAELKAEIERLDALWNSAQDNNFNILGLLHKMRKELKTAKEDNERHKAEVKWWRSQIRDTEDLLAEFDRPIVEVRTEAIKEFAERLKELSYLPNLSLTNMEVVDISKIDNLVKEMTEVDK